MKVGDYVYIPGIGRLCQITAIDREWGGVWVKLNDEEDGESGFLFEDVEIVDFAHIDPRVEAKV